MTEGKYLELLNKRNELESFLNNLGPLKKGEEHYFISNFSEKDRSGILKAIKNYGDNNLFIGDSHGRFKQCSAFALYHKRGNKNIYRFWEIYRKWYSNSDNKNENIMNIDAELTELNLSIAKTEKEISDDRKAFLEE